MFRVYHKPTNKFVTNIQFRLVDGGYGPKGELVIDTNGVLCYIVTPYGLRQVDDNRINGTLRSDYIISRKTGTTDKNGYDIYEGDILKCGNSYTEVRFEEDIDQDFYWGNACGFVFNFASEFMDNHGYEIVGNIYEVTNQ